MRSLGTIGSTRRSLSSDSSMTDRSRRKVSQGNAAQKKDLASGDDSASRESRHLPLKRTSELQSTWSRLFKANKSAKTARNEKDRNRRNYQHFFHSKIHKKACLL